MAIAQSHELSTQVGTVLPALEDPSQTVVAALQALDTLPPIHNSENLQQAFQVFIRMSDQLTDSYRLLEGRVAELRGKLATVSEQRLHELSEKERLANRLTSLLHLLPGGIIVLDAQGEIQECNPAAQALLGEPLLGERWITIIERAFAPQSDDGHEVSLKDGRRVSVVTRSLETEPGQIILITDQTETRKLQHLLNRHERLSAMGKMVASLAHQIRTPLSAAMLYAEHLTKPTIARDKQVKFAEKIVSRLMHLEAHVKDMLIFAKGDMALPDSVTVDELYKGLSVAIETVMAESRATVEWVNEAHSVSVQCNRESLISAIVNLVNNAIQAVGSGAHIIFSASMMDDKHINIMVKDNGPGIDEHVRSSILEPFFTTKSQGTGLGLSVVSAVARAHGGQFVLDSRLGEGTQASLVLPYQHNHDC